MIEGNRNEITNKDKLDCVRRELAMRRNVYRTLVSRRKMSAESAAREIELMEAIAKDYEQSTERS